MELKDLMVPFYREQPDYFSGMLIFTFFVD